MDPTSSVSKGVFIFKNGYKADQHRGRSKKKTKTNIVNENIFASELWFQSYKELWKGLEKKIRKLNNEMFSKILSNLLLYIGDCYKQTVTEIPTATILMGINMPDHFAQFSTLSEEIQATMSPHVAILEAEDCTTIKLLVENMVNQFINNENLDDSDSESDTVAIRKTFCTFSLLSSWYNQKYMAPSTPSKNVNKRQKPNIEKKSLIVIIPEFESFGEAVLRDFILIVSSYLNVLPFIIIFGVATSLATVHKILPYQVTSKMKIQVFSSQSSTEYLNNLLNNVLLTDSCPFHLGGKTFTLFTDIFLFYDFSVKGFIQNFKFAMLKHFYSHGNAISLCTKLENINEILSNFDHDDYESIRRLMSFRKFVESKDFPTRIKLLEDDKFFKAELKKSLKEFHKYLSLFHVLLRCLHQLVHDLPGAPFGKQFRELYAIAVRENVIETSEFKNCLQLLTFLSQDQLLLKLSNISNILKQNIQREKNEILEEVLNIITDFHSGLQNPNNIIDSEKLQKDTKVLTENLNRAKLREELLKMSKDKNPSKIEIFRESNFAILTDVFVQHLCIPTAKPFHEIFVFNNGNSIKNHIVGSHRAAIHTALNNPNWYLQCDCCKLPNELTILPSLPDICTVYKLHLECGKFINMYDWLQAFVTIADPTDADEEERTVDPKLQARFTRAVAELEFLGFIKTSKRKTDHVQRLTWGGC